MDYKKSPQEIQSEIDQASQSIKTGATYRHYKGMGTYKVITFAIREEDNELCVVYQNTENQLHFTRPVKEWLEAVEWEGQTVPRFELLKA